MRDAFLGVVLLASLAAGASVAETPRGKFRAAVLDPARFEQAVAEGLGSDDPLIRRTALCELYEKDPARGLAAARTMLGDPSDEVRLFLADLSSVLPDAESRGAFLDQLGEGASAAVVGAIAKRREFAFHRDNVARSQDPTDDHDYVPVATFELPKTGWAFKFDPRQEHHRRTPTCQSPKFDDAAWRRLAVTAHWESQGCPDYDGIAWYRVRFTLPEKPADGQLTELCFDGVDEEAWVWLNGKYVGQHLEGTRGWNRPFRFDVEKELVWGAENLLVVRVSDTEHGGGIWKPVRVEVLK